MSIPLDPVLQLRFDAAIQDHVAKKAATKRAKSAAREKARQLRDRAKVLEDARDYLRSPDDLGSPTRA